MAGDGAELLFAGTRSTRYAEITNWRVRGGPATAFWQPGARDTAVIAAGTAVVDAPGQQAGALRVAARAGGATPVLKVTAGRLEIGGALTIGDRRGAGRGGRVELAGGTLDVARLEKAQPAGVFAFSGGTLHADTVAFDLVDDGGVIAPGRGARLGRTRMAANLIINRGGLAIGVAGRASDSVDVAGRARLGGALDVVARDGFAPRPGDAWTILRAGRGVVGRFSRVTPGYTVTVVGDRVVLTYGAPRRS